MRERNLTAMLENKGFDVVIVCTSNAAQATYWQQRLEKGRGQIVPPGSTVLAVDEDWEKEAAASALEASETAADGVQAAHEAAGEQYELREIATAEMVVDLDGDGDDEGGGDGDGAMQNALRETAASAAPQAEAASCEAHEPADGEALVHVQPPTLQEVQEAEQGTEQTAAAEALV